MKAPLFCFLLFMALTVHSQTKPYNNRILVLGGGGARGAWGAGYTKFLSDSLGPYSVAFGTSTGSLIAPLAILNDFNTLRAAYTSVNQKDIFNKNPFNEKSGNLKGFNAFIRILFGKRTFGESKNLRKTIDRFLTDAAYAQIRTAARKLQFVVTVVDLASGKVGYRSSTDISDAPKMKDWMWASSNEPLFMSYYNDANTPAKEAFVDGGVLENVPLTAALFYAFDNNIKDIDVVINKPKNPILDTVFKNRRILKGLTRLVDLWSLEIRRDDLLIPQLEIMARACKPPEGFVLAAQNVEDSIRLHLHFYPKEKFVGIYQKELVFNEARMTELWNLGEHGVEDVDETASKQSIVLPVNMLKRYLTNLDATLR